MIKIKRYGWHPGLPQNHTKYAAPRHLLETLPTQVDLRSKMPAIYDQGDLGSCTAHGVSAILHYLSMKQEKPKIFVPDRLAIYYNTRSLEGSTAYDSGGTISDAIKSVVQWGFCDEALYPYDITKFTETPPPSVYGAMWHERVQKYESVNQIANDMKAVLADGNLFTFGFSVYESFESDVVASTGVMPMPKPSEQIIGGHCVTAVGYDDSKEVFIIRNSWGTSWGQAGYFTMPYEFMLNSNYASDFWTILYIP